VIWLKISLTVNYVLDIDDRFDFYDSKSHKILECIDEELTIKFPKEVTLSEKVKGVRSSLTYIPITENKSYVRCFGCGKYLSISENIYLGLDRITEINGKNYCSSCAWELKTEL